LRILHVLVAAAALTLSGAALAQTSDQPNGAPAGSGTNPPGGDVQGGEQSGAGMSPRGHMMHHHHHHRHHHHHHMM
jgi:hypothetical protein